jgi:hypothetical protein
MILAVQAKATRRWAQGVLWNEASHGCTISVVYHHHDSCRSLLGRSECDDVSRMRRKASGRNVWIPGIWVARLQRLISKHTDSKLVSSDFDLLCLFDQRLILLDLFPLAFGRLGLRNTSRSEPSLLSEFFTVLLIILHRKKASIHGVSTITLVESAECLRRPGKASDLPDSLAPPSHHVA